MERYDSEFYRDRNKLTRLAAETILALVQRAIPKIEAAIDVGCGVGTWLSVLREQGVAEVAGIDGDWVDRESLVIPPDCFIRRDLSVSDIDLKRKYDLVISLEVAEHLPPERAEPFVTRLTELGDFVLFSAAIPGQGGVNHVNEQWPEYWIELFGRRGYAPFDIIRRHIWAEDRIAVHYRQNILLFVKRERVPDLRIADRSVTPEVFSVVHPRLFENKLRAWQNPTIRESAARLMGAIGARVRRQFRAQGDGSR